MTLRKYLLLDKKVGETPLEVLDQFKRQYHEYAAVPLSYAGRLDPLASGALLVLVGEECKKQKKYLGLDKEYEFEVALGISTDTGDVLGLPSIETKVGIKDSAELNIEKMFTGKHNWKYPPFSSKTVDGVPLFKHALEGTIDTVAIPTKEIEIYDLKYNGAKTYSSRDFFGKISKKIESIKPTTEHSKALGNDFRRPEIREQYDAIKSTSPETFQVLTFTCICSSGTYMRTLAQKIAKELGTTGLAFSIHRTHIGRYTKVGPIAFWSKKF